MTNPELDNQNRAITQFAQLTGIAQGDPLALSNSDAHGASLTGVPFYGGNFIAWSRQITMALGAKLKLGFIDGSLPRPVVGSGDLARWERCDRMVACWILNSMVPDLSNSFIYTSSAHNMWKEIVERYSQGTAPMIYQLKQELMHITQGNLSVTAYYTKLKRCWDEIQCLNGIPVCECGMLDKCQCKVMARFLELEDQDRLMQFLLNLNGNFDAVKSYILSQDPLPKINRAYYLVMQAKKSTHISHTVIDPVAFLVTLKDGKLGAGESSANAAMNKNGNQDKKDWKKGKTDEKKHCNFCNKDGHNSDSCFEVIGYPDWYKGKRKYRTGVAAHASHESPLDTDHASSRKSGNIDPKLMQAFCREMMRAFQGQVVMPSMANFAGPFE